MSQQPQSAHTNSPQICALGLDAGGTYFKFCLVDHSGNIVDGSTGSLRIDTEGDAGAILDGYAQAVAQALCYARERGYRVAAVGVSTPGPFDYARHTSLMVHKMRSIRGIDIQLETERRVPGAPPMFFLHDSHAFLLGEYRLGAARGFRNAAAVTIGTGTGFAVIEDGELRTNGTGGPYISIFQRSFLDATVEHHISRGGILRRYSALSGRSIDGSFDVADLARWALQDGDQQALETFRWIGKALAEVVGDILLEQRTECLVLGGQIAKAFVLMQSALCDGLDRVPTLLKIAQAQHIDTAAQLGAASAALQALRAF